MNLSQFYGTENYYKHPFSKVVYTDGVQYFAQEAGAYWFLDKALIEYALLHKAHEFLSIELMSANNQALVSITDGNDNILKTDAIEFTDCPEGKYCFFMTNNVLMLTSEY
jgi:hypothetical protein